MTTVYHITSVFQPTEDASREQFDSRIDLIGRRIEQFIKRSLWYSANCPDDLDDAFQGGLLRLWKLYQEEPLMMGCDDRWWQLQALRGAERTLIQMKTQRGMTRKGRVEQLERNASSFITRDDDQDGMDCAERHHARRTGFHRAESDLADRHIDLERLVKTALEHLAPQYRQSVRSLIPYLAEGLSIHEAARLCGLQGKKADVAWTAFQEEVHSITGEATSRQKDRRVSPSAEEYKVIRDLAAKGLSTTQIAEQIHRSKTFVKNHFAEATGYRRGSHQQNTPITPEKIEQMRRLRAQGMGYGKIAKTVGCSNDSVYKSLNGK